MKALLLAALVATTTFGKAYDVKGKAEFRAEAFPGFLKINGTGGIVTGAAEEKDSKLVGTFKAKVSDFTTDMKLRDEHMQDKYMEKAKCPEIILELDPYAPTDKQFSGKLTFHCVTKPITGKASLADGKVKAEFEVIPSQFGVTDVSHLGVGMDDKLTAIVELELISK